jgi:hypothetical protein
MNEGYYIEASVWDDDSRSRVKVEICLEVDDEGKITSVRETAEY